ncbi:MAG: 3'-5' exoribonuclease YhaM family protein [Phycisphaerae bacterium]
MTMPANARKQNIVHLEAGQRIDEEIYRIAQKDLRTTTNGSLYIHSVLADATGEMLARIWNASQELYDSMPEGGFMRFRGRVENYKGHRQFIIDGMRIVAEHEVDPTEFLPATKKNVEQMWSRTKEILRSIENPHLIALVAEFVNDERFVRSFKNAPAAVTNHHAYLGGLLEHTLNLLELVVLIAPRYPEVSRDLLLVSIFLHDSGKTAELGYSTNFTYTNEGQLIGHITLAVIWVAEKIRIIEDRTNEPFPVDLANAVKHIILAHHGRYEYGSPRLPAMAEAFFVHYIDNLDAKMNQVFAAIESDPDKESDWTGFVRALDTKIYKPDVMGIRPTLDDLD